MSCNTYVDDTMTRSGMCAVDEVSLKAKCRGIFSLNTRCRIFPWSPGRSAVASTFRSVLPSPWINSPGAEAMNFTATELVFRTLVTKRARSKFPSSFDDDPLPSFDDEPLPSFDDEPVPVCEKTAPIPQTERSA